nr:type II secretion system F family protein [Vibrio fluminensis]
MDDSDEKHIAQYCWRGVNRRGKRCSGTIVAITQHEVREQLKRQGIQPTSLICKPLSKSRIRLNQIKSKEITLLTRQLATMLAAGIPLIQAINLIGERQTNTAMKILLLRLKQRTTAGSPLKQIFLGIPHFDSLYIELLCAAELSGNLAQVFQHIADHREKSQQLHNKLRKASIYPTIVLLISLSITYLMLTLVIPEFQIMFDSFDAELPWFTQQVIQLSVFLQTYGFSLIISLAASIMVLKWTRKRASHFNHLISQLTGKLPIIGSISHKAFIARYTRTLATCITAGIPLLTCLKSASQNHQTLCRKQALTDIYRNTNSGMPLYLAMRDSHLFCEMSIQMIMIGEESGRLDEMLDRVAILHENQLNEDIENLTKLLEPAIIVILSVIVASLVLAIYLPIFNLMNVIG